MAPNDTSVYVGDTVALSCVSHGLPFPSISWTRQGEPLRQPVAVNQTQISGGHVTFLQSTLLLCSLTLSDTGLYTCSASNNHSSAQQTFSITVKGTYNNRSLLYLCVHLLPIMRGLVTGKPEKSARHKILQTILFYLVFFHSCATDCDISKRLCIFRWEHCSFLLHQLWRSCSPYPLVQRLSRSPHTISQRHQDSHLERDDWNWSNFGC